MKITEINSRTLGNITLGGCIYDLSGEPKVKSIEYSSEYGTHFVTFEDVPYTLEVFDVNYVIRDEE